MSKWKQIESYMESKSFHESKFNINKKQAQMILDLKKDELKKMRFLAMLDIDKDELKQLAKKDPSIVKAIGRQGGSFRTAMVRKRANEENELEEAIKHSYVLIDTSRNNKVVGSGSDKKSLEMDINTANLPPLNIKNKSALKVVKLKRPKSDNMAGKLLGEPLKSWGEEIEEDAPTNSNAAGGVDMNPTGLSMKKKKELDARTKEYKIHARKLMAQREKRKLKAQKNLCGSFRKSVKENIDNFGIEEFIVEDNVAILRKIVKDKRNMPVKLKDGQMKVDLYTASALVQTLDKIKKPDTKKKLEFIINKGNKAQFLRTVDVVFK